MAETLPALFLQQASRYADRPLFWRKLAGRYQSISWRDAAAAVDAFAAFLLDRGILPGDRVLIFSENRPEWGIADLAIQSVGAWSVPLYPTLTPADLAVIGRDSRPAAAVVSTDDHAARLAASGTVPGTVVVMEPGAGAGLRWTAALEQGKASLAARTAELRARRAALRPDATATLIYTSGTTGEPKGVMLSHRNFLSNVDAALQVIRVSETDRHLSFLPLCHVFERTAGWYLMVSAGAEIAFAETMDTVGDNMREIRPTVMLGVPRFFEKLYARVQEGLRAVPAGKRRLVAWAQRVGAARAAALTQGRPVPFGVATQHALADRLVFHKLRGRLGGRLRFFISGSAPLSREIAEFFFSLGVVILEGYGLTETSPVIAVNRPPVPVFGTVGPPLPGLEVRIAPEDGEILTRGPHVMQGYYQKPAETAAMIVEGWLHTGDIGHLDAAGCLIITDRKKDLIKTSGGKFVAPQKLEGRFITDPAIAQAFVFGDKRPYCVALIVPNAAALALLAEREGLAGLPPAELVQHPHIHAAYWAIVQEKQRDLAKFEQVKKIAVLSQEFTQAGGELTPTLKAKRQVIAQRQAAVLERLYAG